jgi:hypothetical protein
MVPAPLALVASEKKVFRTTNEVQVANATAHVGTQTASTDVGSEQVQSAAIIALMPST